MEESKSISAWAVHCNCSHPFCVPGGYVYVTGKNPKPMHPYDELKTTKEKLKQARSLLPLLLLVLVVIMAVILLVVEI